MSYGGETVWIIGASSGIGEALARTLSDQGATLILSARREDALRDLAEELGGHRIIALDIADAAAVVEATRAAFDAGRIDRIVLLAAIYDPSGIQEIDLDFARKITDVNLLGVVHVAQATVPTLELQGGGQLAICGSVAGYVGLPDGQIYSATKAAVINFTETLHAERPETVDIKLISPGFVRTPMTDKNEFDMPMIIEPEDAAEAIAKGLRRGRFEIHFPWRFTMMLKLLRVLPYGLRLWATRRTGKG